MLRGKAVPLPGPEEGVPDEVHLGLEAGVRERDASGLPGLPGTRSGEGGQVSGTAEPVTDWRQGPGEPRHLPGSEAARCGIEKADGEARGGIQFHPGAGILGHHPHGPGRLGQGRRAGFPHPGQPGDAALGRGLPHHAGAHPEAFDEVGPLGGGDRVRRRPGGRLHGLFAARSRLGGGPTGAQKEDGNEQEPAWSHGGPT